MTRSSRKLPSRSTVAAYLCIGAALVLLLVLTVWGTYRDMQFLYKTLVQAELEGLRAHAQRTAGWIERDLERLGPAAMGQLEEAWLDEHWNQTSAHQHARFLYGAVVDKGGNLVAHSRGLPEGDRHLPSDWYHHHRPDIGRDVVETSNPLLTGGGRAFDLRVPIVVNSHQFGNYHVGLDASRFDAWFAEKQAEFIRGRSLLIGGVGLIVLAAAGSLYFLTTRSITLQRAMETAYLERVVEVGKLAAGLAHEIRNPLHAIRLNLHSFQRAHQRQAKIPPEETKAMLEESTHEIERIDQLLQELLGFATPHEPREELIDLSSEVGAVVEFLQQEMLRKRIHLDVKMPKESIAVRMDQGRLRQIMLNLLQNAQHAMDGGGHIRVGLARRRGRAEITVADDGPGVSDMDRPRVFEPFFSTKEGGNGLGLALVKRFVEEVNGQVCCEANQWGGTTFRVVLPEAQQP